MANANGGGCPRPQAKGSAAVGCLVGGLLGILAGLAYTYLAMMVPNAIPLSEMWHRLLPVLATGPLGAVVGAIVGNAVEGRRAAEVGGHDGEGRVP